MATVQRRQCHCGEAGPESRAVRVSAFSARAGQSTGVVRPLERLMGACVQPVVAYAAARNVPGWDDSRTTDGRSGSLPRSTAKLPSSQVRGTGLILGMELMRDKAKRIPFDSAHGVGARLGAAAQNHGLIVRVVGDRLVFAPPLIIEAPEIEAIAERLGRALDEVATDLAREGELRTPVPG